MPSFIENMFNLRNILLTGANGFVGKALCRNLLEQGFRVRAVVRSQEKANMLQKLFASSQLECVVVADFTKTKWQTVLDQVDAIIHLAARAHVVYENNPASSAEYQLANVAFTEQLAKAAVTHHVTRFLYMSSVMVTGTATQSKPFTEIDLPNPHNIYAHSKWRAEQVLQEISKNSDLKVTILRSPVVYGQGVKANFQSLLKLVQSGLPIPLGRIQNQRSLIYVENLVDAIVTCLQQEAAIGQTYLVADAEPVSTPDLIRQIAAALNKPARLWPFPIAFLKGMAKMIGKSAMVDKLLESLVIDCAKIKNELGWQPPYTLQEGLMRDFGTRAEKC